MDDLPLILASKDLFLSLSTLKIKTLKQAEEHLKTNDNEKVRGVLNQYEKIQRKVFETLNNESSYIDFSTLKCNFDENHPFHYYLSSPSLIQILGAKGAGKTALSLRMGLDYSNLYPQNFIKIINCGGGITLNRLKPFLKLNFEYVDIFSIEDLQQMLINLKKSKKVGLMILDSVTSLILGAPSQRNGLGDWLSTLREIGWTVVFTNLIQGKLEIEEKEVLNSMGYFPNLFGGIIDCRVRIDPHGSKQNNFLVRTLKTLNNKSYEYSTEMSACGLSELLPEEVL